MSKTILLVHGAWVTTSCWTNFKEFLESKGHEVIVPAWPYLDKSVAELRRHADPLLAKQTIKGLVDYFESQVRALPSPPILMGHSFGGLIVQMLLDRGLGAAGVAIDAGPPRGVLPSFTAIKSALPVLLAWRGWNRILSMSFESFSKTFANTLPPSAQLATYDQHIVPAPGRIYFQAALGIGNGVKFNNPNRPPLLLIAASEDRTSTTSMVRAMHRKHSRAPSRTDIMEFPARSHWLIAEPGWQEVAEKAIDWAERRAK
ncbi:alpha/beta hydrolase [Pinirhizobacter soli]|uniref:alpha/beta hydrolase n=1 Tax=Pinirhizobacter soli TaxID=2786953 RepID=UPI002029B7D6|nr:alpha/beta hydrolase [Pinirhizobacter soli]